MKTPDVPGALLLDPSAESMGDIVDVTARLIISPATGRLRHLPPTRFHGGAEWVSAGQAVAVIEMGETIVSVIAPFEARVAGVLARDGEPVLRGQPLVWLEESAAPPAQRSEQEGQST